MQRWPGFSFYAIVLVFDASFGEYESGNFRPSASIEVGELVGRHGRSSFRVLVAVNDQYTASRKPIAARINVGWLRWRPSRGVILDKKYFVRQK